MANPKKRKKLVLFAVIGGALLIIAFVVAARKKDPAIAVQTEKVSRRSLTEIVVANGKIQPVKQVVISPEVAGEIVKLPVKEGDHVKQGDLLVQIKPDNYIASRNSADSQYKSAISGKSLAKAQLEKAEAEYKRNEELFQSKLVSESVYLEFKTTWEVAKLEYETAAHREDQARFGLDKAKDDLSKTTILAPMDGTVTRLESQLGERVLGTSFNKGTEIMIISDLNEMEAVVDIGEMDVVLMARDQITRLEVDAFKNRKFAGVVTEVANSAKGTGLGSSSSSSFSSSSGQQEATKFEVHIRIKDKEPFRPGMSVTAEIETRYRTNVLAVPFASVTARLPKSSTNSNGAVTGNGATNATMTTATTSSNGGTNSVRADRKSKEGLKQIEVVFVVDGDHVNMVPVKIGITDGDYYEIIEGLQEEQEVVSGGYRAISKDLEDSKKITRGTGSSESEKKAL